MKPDEELPENNPEQTCVKCGGKYPIWQLFFDSQEKRLRVGHTFMPPETRNGAIEYICIDCIFEARHGYSVPTIFVKRKTQAAV